MDKYRLARRQEGFDNLYIDVIVGLRLHKEGKVLLEKMQDAFDNLYTDIAKSERV